MRARSSLFSSISKFCTGEGSVFASLSGDSRVLSQYSTSISPSASVDSKDQASSGLKPRELPLLYKPRDVYGGTSAVPFVAGTQSSPAAHAYRNPLFRVLPGGRIVPMALTKWIKRKKGPFRPKQRMYSMGMNVMPLLGAESLPSSAQEIADRAATEGRELTTRERIYSILLEQRGKQIAPEYSIKESLTPAREEIQVADKEVFAVVEIKGYQHKVHPDDILYTQKVEEWKVNDIVELKKVLLLGSKYETMIGRPLLSGAKVVCLVEEKFKDAHQLHYRKRKRNNRHKKLIGFRRELVKLRVLDIQGIEAVPKNEKPVEIAKKTLGPAPPPRIPKHMRNYIKIAEELYADPKSFRYIGLKNGLVLMDRIRRRRSVEAGVGGGAGAPEEQTPQSEDGVESTKA